MIVREDVMQGLKPMFEKADKGGLWFHCAYQGLWFSPAELRAHHAKGEFVWGAGNWTLRDPRVNLKDLDRQIEELKKRRDNFVKRMEKADG